MKLLQICFLLRLIVVTVVIVFIKKKYIVMYFFTTIICKFEFSNLCIEHYQFEGIRLKIIVCNFTILAHRAHFLLIQQQTLLKL